MARTSPAVVDALWRLLRDGVVCTQPDRMAIFTDRFRAADLVPRWAVLDLVEDLGLYHLVHAEDFDTLLGVFEVAFVTGYARPRSRVRVATGCEYLALADVAELAIMLERCGLPVDPAPLVAVVKPRLKGKALLTGAELRVWWFDQERHRSEGMTMAADGAGRSVRVEEVRTPGGYKVEAWIGADGRAMSLWVGSPRYRRPRRAAA